MNRFKAKPATDIVYEAVVPQLTVTWNPQTNVGSVQFWTELEEYHKTLNDVDPIYMGSRAHPQVEFRPLVVTLDTILADTYDVLLPDGTTTQVSGTLMMAVVKAAFDKYYEQKMIELTPPEVS